MPFAIVLKGTMWLNITCNTLTGILIYQGVDHCRKVSWTEKVVKPEGNSRCLIGSLICDKQMLVASVQTDSAIEHFCSKVCVKLKYSAHLGNIHMYRHASVFGTFVTKHLFLVLYINAPSVSFTYYVIVLSLLY